MGGGLRLMIHCLSSQINEVKEDSQLVRPNSFTRLSNIFGAKKTDFFEINIVWRMANMLADQASL